MQKGISGALGHTRLSIIDLRAAALLDLAALSRTGLLDPAPIQEKWAEHQSGLRDWQYFLWNVLMFEAWRRQCAK
jgi:asparagine synthase (glutamine-hydrolysing)